MQAERFHQFVQMIEGIHKSVSKIRMSYAPYLGIKSVHVFWLYELLFHPEGLTASSLAATGKIDRSLVSREIEELLRGGYVEVVGGGTRRNYNSRIVLTEKGRELAMTITELGRSVQSEANLDLTEEELASFYCTLSKLEHNLSVVAERKEFPLEEQA